MGSALDLKDVRFRYLPEEPLLEGVSLEVETGEVAGLIGPNGSGKSTLLSIIAATTRHESGKITAFNESLRAMPARQRARVLALVPQEPTVAFPFTVLEIALMGRAPYLGRFELEGKNDIDIAKEALNMTGLSKLADRRFRDLSGGERQRVMIAKALAQQSKIVLLDEPTAFLDLKHQVEIYELVSSLAREKQLAVLTVSHDINLAAMYCKRLAVLSGGKIVAHGRPEDVLDPALLEDVYGVPVGMADRGDGAPLVYPRGGAAS